MPDNSQLSRDEFFQQDEKINKALKTVRKAAIMRIFVTVLLIWILFQTSMELWIVGLMVFVILINLTGAIPLIQEWRKQKRKLDELWDQE